MNVAEVARLIEERVFMSALGMFSLLFLVVLLVQGCTLAPVTRDDDEPVYTYMGIRSTQWVEFRYDREIFSDRPIEYYYCRNGGPLVCRNFNRNHKTCSCL